jgi:hypothetical protein
MDLAAFFAAAGLPRARPAPYTHRAGADHDPRLCAAFQGHTGQLDAMKPLSYAEVATVQC